MSPPEAPRIFWFAGLLFLLLLALVTAGIVAFAKVVAAHFKGGRGGWAGLTQAYAVPTPPSGRLLKRQTLIVGRILYRNCVTIGLTPQGIGLAIDLPFNLFRKPTLFIPWTEVAEQEPARLYWQQAVLLWVGLPIVGSITVPMRLYAQIEPFLPKRTGKAAQPA